MEPLGSEIIISHYSAPSVGYFLNVSPSPITPQWLDKQCKHLVPHSTNPNAVIILSILNSCLFPSESPLFISWPPHASAHLLLIPSSSPPFLYSIKYALLTPCQISSFIFLLHRFNFTWFWTLLDDHWQTAHFKFWSCCWRSHLIRVYDYIQGKVTTSITFKLSNSSKPT